jgi:hypothetical protein
MPFTWDYSQCKDWKKTIRRRRRKGERGYSDPNKTRYVLKDQYQTIIEAAMYIGIPSITEANYVKFYNRVRLNETVSPSWFREVRGKMVPIPIKLDDVKQMIGLRTNGARYGAGEFHKRYIKKHV